MCVWAEIILFFIWKTAWADRPVLVFLDFIRYYCKVPICIHKPVTKFPFKAELLKRFNWEALSEHPPCSLASILAYFLPVLMALWLLKHFSWFGFPTAPPVTLPVWDFPRGRTPILDSNQKIKLKYSLKTY